MSSVLSGRRKWTAQEDMRLRSMRSQGIAYREIARVMGRSKSAVMDRGCRLGLMTPITRRSDEDDSTRHRRLKRTNRGYLTNVQTLPDEFLRQVNRGIEPDAELERIGEEAIERCRRELREQHLRRMRAGLSEPTDDDGEVESDWEPN